MCDKLCGPIVWWAYGEGWCAEHTPIERMNADHAGKTCGCGVPVPMVTRDSVGNPMWEDCDHSCPPTAEEGGEPDTAEILASMADTQAALQEWDAFIISLAK